MKCRRNSKLQFAWLITLLRAVNTGVQWRWVDKNSEGKKNVCIEVEARNTAEHFTLFEQKCSLSEKFWNFALKFDFEPTIHRFVATHLDNMVSTDTENRD